MNNNYTSTISDSTIYLTPKNKAIASIIWLHGLGANANDLTCLPHELNLQENLNIRHIFPNAPIRQVTFAEGMAMNAWFDIVDLSLESPQDEQGILEANNILEKIIENEIQSGIESNKIILAGFSQGGAMALYSGLRYRKTLGAILALSSFMPLSNKLPKEKSIQNEATPILMTHGIHDPLIPLNISKHFHSYLTSLNYKVKLNIYNMAHEICPEEIADISQWITDLLSVR